MSTPPATFDEFWTYYLNEHRDPTCRRLHVVGTSTAVLCILSAPLFPPLLLLAPVVGYGLAWVGHLRFEGNKPASWNSPRDFAWSFACDLRMVALTLTGRLGPHLRSEG